MIPKIRYVPQRTGADCGVATIAMVADITYKAAFRSLSKAARDQVDEGTGINHSELEMALRKHGFIAFLAIHEHYAGGERKRSRWPPEPIGWRHIISSQNPEGTHHFSAMDAAGRVFDPFNPLITDISAYHRVNEVTLIIRPTAPFAF